MLRLLGGPSQLLLELLAVEAICALHIEGCGLGASREFAGATRVGRCRVR
jgi:hypothetical protein